MNRFESFVDSILNLFITSEIGLSVFLFGGFLAIVEIFYGFRFDFFVTSLPNKTNPIHRH